MCLDAASRGGGGGGGGGEHRRHGRGQQGRLLHLCLRKQHCFVLALGTHEVDRAHGCQGEAQDEAQQAQGVGQDAGGGRDVEQSIVGNVLAQHVLWSACGVCVLCGRGVGEQV